ncbi:MAG: D-alanyl-D-alanine carboxypeptidase family protein [bacterium]|nr:D-alanyl-D-alanine carboxypeptidase family protein [bacterium]
MFNDREKAMMESLHSKLTAAKKANPENLLITISELIKKLSVKQIGLVEKILSIDPKEYGIKNLPYYGLAPYIPANLVRLDDWSGRFLPMPVFLYYYCLNQAIIRDLDLDCPIIVRDGYRSDAEQLQVFMGRLIQKNWEVEKVLREAALPGYSQHSYPRINGGYMQAIDFAVNGSSKFSQTVHYGWLKHFAWLFGFYEPYGENNKYGIGPEKWHWVCFFEDGIGRKYLTKFIRRRLAMRS